MSSLLLFGLGCGFLALAYLFRKTLYKYLQIVKYEIIYWNLGAIAMTHDYIYSSCNKLKERPSRRNDVVIVTGGARGMGVEVVKILLECDMTVVIACRNVQAGKNTEQQIREQGITSGKLDVLQLDVASLASVKEFANNFLAKYSKLHILFNNAGVMFVPKSKTEDGFEAHLATNYLGHALLTHLLMPALIRGGQERDYYARIVNVSSCAHIPGQINFEDVNCEKSLYIASQMYAQSKLAQIMFTKAGERRLREKSLPVSMFSLHPGIVDTDLFNGTPIKTIAPWFTSLFFKKPKEGGISIAFVGISSSIEKKGGSYFSNCRELWVSSAAGDVAQQERLMELTEKLLHIHNLCQVD